MSIKRLIPYYAAFLAGAILLPAFAIAQSTSSAPADGPAWQPPKTGDVWSREYFGDDKSIELLDSLLKDEDATVRERIAQALGQTDNVKSLPLIAQLAGDPATNVRIAAVAAAADLRRGDYSKILVAGLSDKEEGVIVQACASVGACGVADAKESLLKLLESPSAQIRLASLNALTSLKMAAPTARLQSLLAPESPVAVRLAAANNAAFGAKDEKALIDDIAQVAQKDAAAAVRGAAVATLGRLAFDANADAISKARKDPNALVRRGAVEAYRFAGKTPPVKEFLADSSPLVRLAAIKLSGELRLAESVPQLLEALRGVPDDAHDAARESLIRIGNDEVTSGAGAMAAEMYKLALAVHQESLSSGALKEASVKVKQAEDASEAAQKKYDAQAKAVAAMPAKTQQDKNKAAAARKELDTEKKALDAATAAVAEANTQVLAAKEAVQERSRTRERHIRNLRSCCRILGELKSPQGLAVRLEIVQAAASAGETDLVQCDSELLVEVVTSLGQLGDNQAAEPVSKLLAIHAKWAPHVGSETPPKGFRYRESVDVATIEAMGNLRDARAISSMTTIAEVKIKSGRLCREAGALMRAFIPLSGVVPAGTIETVTGKIVRDPTYDLGARFEAARTIGRLGIKKNLSGVQQLLDERGDRNTMRIAAWTIGQLTGQTPSIGDPVFSENEMWIIKRK